MRKRNTIKGGTSLGWALGAALLAAGLTGTAGPVAAQSARTPVAGGAPMVQVNTGRGKLITLARPMSDLFVADDTVADVQVRSPTQLYVFGKKVGETTISATAKGGAVVYAATVRVGNNYDSIGQMLATAMPDSQIVATPMNGLVLLSGTVSGPQDAEEAARLVQAYVGDSTKVLSRIKTATPLQVNLQVRFAEVTRNFAKNINANVRSFDGTGGFRFGISQDRGAGPQFVVPGAGVFTGGTNASADTSLITQGGQRTTLGLAGKLLGLDLLGALDLGETAGQVTTLANPNLTALSGETGTFLAGGEIPIPIAQGLGTISVEFKQYGVSLAYTPTVLSDGRISLRVRPEVSQLDYSNAITLSGTRVPGLTTRRAETTVELGSGQSFMIGGLIQSFHNNSFDKTPGVGDVPILGALFRSNAFQRGESELVIVVTPYLVKPVNNVSDIKLPTDGLNAPTDLGRIFMGQLATGQSGGQRPVPTMAAPNPASPTVGAVAPLPVGPSLPAGEPARDKAVAGNRPKKATVPLPGFSSN